jgi:hypothetical protein
MQFEIEKTEKSRNAKKSLLQDDLTMEMRKLNSQDAMQKPPCLKLYGTDSSLEQYPPPKQHYETPI